jgi:hypothetical protein
MPNFDYDYEQDYDYDNLPAGKREMLQRLFSPESRAFPPGNPARGRLR